MSIYESLCLSHTQKNMGIDRYIYMSNTYNYMFICTYIYMSV